MGKLKTKDDLGVDLSFLSSGPSTSKPSTSKAAPPAENRKAIHFKTNDKVRGQSGCTQHHSTAHAACPKV